MIQSQLSELKLEERIINILVAAVSGQGDTALLQETLSAAADEFRQITIESSKKFAGVTDGETVLTNELKGKSDGLNGDGFGTGGTRIDLDQLCGVGDFRCIRNADNSLKTNGQGQVQFDPKEAGENLAAFLKSEEGLAMRGATGGVQGAIGTLFGEPYAAGSWQDKLIESFGGTHDYIGGQLSGLYDEQGNATQGRSDALKAAQEAWSSGPAIAISAPFAAAGGLSPAVWQAISTLLKGAQ